MIEVTVKHDGREVARIKIDGSYAEPTGESSDYAVQFAVDTGEGTLAMYQRSVYGFHRKKLNALALLRLALTTLEEKELSLDGDIDAPHPSGLGRQLGRALWPF